MKQNRMDFLARLNESGKTARGPRNKYLLVIIAAALVVAVLEGAMLVRVYAKLVPSLDYAAGRLAESQLSADYNMALAKQDELSALQAQLDNLEGAMSAIESYPRMDEDVFHVVDIAASDDMRILSLAYDSVSGALTLECTAADVLSASGYAGELRASGAFANIGYTGYGYQTETQSLTLPVEQILYTDYEQYFDETELEEMRTAEAGTEEFFSVDYYYYAFTVTCFLKGGDAE